MSYRANETLLSPKSAPVVTRPPVVTGSSAAANLTTADSNVRTPLSTKVMTVLPRDPKWIPPHMRLPLKAQPQKEKIEQDLIDVNGPFSTARPPAIAPTSIPADAIATTPSPPRRPSLLDSENKDNPFIATNPLVPMATQKGKVDDKYKGGLAASRWAK